MAWLYEKLHLSWTQGFEIEETVFEQRSEHQELVVFKNSMWGRVLALDGVIQTTTADEAHYHEMLLHVPVRAHGSVENILIIGGSDGGSLREALRYPAVKAVQVEIDRSVIDMCKTYLPTISRGAFDNPRAEIIIADGASFAAETARRFDVIIIDSTDPIGPGEALFTERFYRDCRRCLAPGGVLATQLGNPAMSPQTLALALERLKASDFAYIDYYLTDIPTYIGGMMSLGFATDNGSLSSRSIEALSQTKIDDQLRYYTPSVHRASFVHPAWMQRRFGR